MRRRVVITGIGIVTPLGSTSPQMWENLVGGRTGVGPLTLFDASRYPVRIAAEVRDWDMSQVGEDPQRWQHCHRQTRFGVGAGIQAARQAELEGAQIDPLRLGVYLGCGEPFQSFDAFASCVSRSVSEKKGESPPFVETALHYFDPEAEREYEPDLPGVYLAGLFDAQGPSSNCIAACVSGTQAIGEAARLIRRGEADVMMAGGAHSTVHPFGCTGFQRLSALSKRNSDPAAASRPFDRDRDGFVIGEGAAVVVLEDLEHAQRRGVEILGELTGYGSSQDAFRVTDTHPDARGSVIAMRRALGNAQVAAEDIDYVNAHGTSTVLNDQVETAALKQVFGHRAYQTPVSSTKSMMGHATTACGAIELAICVLALRHSVLPPTVNYETPDPRCDLDYVPNNAREVKCRHILSNNLGFGGQNAALVVSRFDESSPANVSMHAA